MLLMNSQVWLFVLICCIPLGGIRAEGYAVIKGKAEAGGELTEMQLMVVANGVPVKYAGTTIASTGSFAFMFEPGEAGFYYLYDGQEYYRIYVEAGKEINVSFEAGQWHFSEGCGAENQLLGQWRNREQILKSYRKDVPYAAFFPRFDSVRLETALWLNQVKIENQGFLSQLKTVVELDLLNDFVSYVGKCQQAYESEEQQSGYYQQIIKRFPVEDESLLGQPYGMEVIRKYFNYKESYVFRNRGYTLDQKLAELVSPLIKAEFVLTEVDTGSFESFCEYERKYFPLLLNDNQRFRMRHAKGRPFASLQSGKRASNFIFPDTSGRMGSMADFEGKYKYIDIWATWCAPCKAEIPYLQKLEAEFAGQDIEFISISIDKNRKKWEEYVRTQGLGGTQLWAGDWKNLPEELHVGSVPRFLLINRQGNWVDTNAARPSDPALRKLLKNLLKK